MNRYEGVFILKSTLNNEAQEKLVEDIKGVITKHQGETIEVQNWGKRKLAYLIKKQHEGVYCFLEFKLVPTSVKKIEDLFKLNDSILRTLILRKD